MFSWPQHDANQCPLAPLFTPPSVSLFSRCPPSPPSTLLKVANELWISLSHILSKVLHLPSFNGSVSLSLRVKAEKSGEAKVTSLLSLLAFCKYRCRSNRVSHWEIWMECVGKRRLRLKCYVGGFSRDLLFRYCSHSWFCLYTGALLNFTTPSFAVIINKSSLFLSGHAFTAVTCFWDKLFVCVGFLL